MNFPPPAGRVSGRATPSLRHAPRAKLQRTNPGSSPLSLRGILFRGSGLALLSGRWQTIHIFTASPGRARHDAGAIPREMELATRLSHGCAELRGTAVCVGEADRTWPD